MTSASALATRLDPTGRVVLPSEVRRQLRLTPGTRFRVTVLADRIELTPEPATPAQLLRQGGRLVIAAEPAALAPPDAAAAIRAERDEIGARVRRG